MGRTKIREHQVEDADFLSEQEHVDIGDSAPHHARAHNVENTADHNVEGTVGNNSSLSFRTSNNKWKMVKNNVASGAPTVNDDSSVGYEITSRWWDTDADLIYDCMSAAVGAAKWVVAGGARLGSPEVQRGFTFPSFNGLINFLGWYEETDAAASLTSAAPVTPSEAGFSSHFVVDVSAAVGLPFTLRFTGRSITETDETEVDGDTEDIVVSADGFYQTSKTWLDAPEISIVEASKSCTMDIVRTSYWDRGNTDFTVSGLRLEWEPSSTVWDITLRLLRVENDGSLTTIHEIPFSGTDTILRAANGIKGKHKKTDLNIPFLGSENSGVIIEVDQFAQRHIFFEVRY